MNRPVLIAVIVMLIALGLVFVFGSRNSTKDTTNTPAEDASGNTQLTADETPTDTSSTLPTNADTATEAIVVRYTNTGYEPKTITVPAGTTVTFKNESTSNMWTASDPHPIHTKLSAFDSDKNIAPGQSYQFTFTKAGNWTYHNHSVPNHTGTVVVE